MQHSNCHLSDFDGLKNYTNSVFQRHLLIVCGKGQPDETKYFQFLYVIQYVTLLGWRFTIPTLVLKLLFLIYRLQTNLTLLSTSIDFYNWYSFS